MSLYTTTRLFLLTRFSYDSENGFSLLEQQALTYKNTEGYRGIYKDNDFYVAGNGEIKHFKLAE